MCCSINFRSFVDYISSELLPQSTTSDLCSTCPKISSQSITMVSSRNLCNFILSMLIPPRVAAARSRKSMATTVLECFLVAYNRQLPQTRLVTGWWLVRTTCELESEYGNHGCGHCWSDGFHVGRQCRERSSDKISRRGTLLPQPIVRTTLQTTTLYAELTNRSWSKQIIEHEKAQKKGGS